MIYGKALVDVAPQSVCHQSDGARKVRKQVIRLFAVRAEELFKVHGHKAVLRGAECGGGDNPLFSTIIAHAMRLARLDRP